MLKKEYYADQVNQHFVNTVQHFKTGTAGK